MESSIKDKPRRPMLGATAAMSLLLAINMFNYVDRYVLAAVEGPIRAEFFPESTSGERAQAGDSTAVPSQHAADSADSNAKSKMGLLAFAFLISYIITSPIFGWLADRVSRWKIVAGGVLAWSLASGASGWAPTFAALVIARIFVGIGEASYGPVAPTLLADYYAVEKRGQKLSLFYMAIPVGSALGFLLGGLVGEHWNWRWAFYLSMPPGIVLGLCALWMREPKRGMADHATPNRTARWADYLVLARTPTYVLNTAGMAAMTFAVGGLAFWMPTYISEIRGLDKLASASIKFGAITAVTGLVGTLAGGVLGDWLRPRWSGAYFLVSGLGMLIAFPFFLLAIKGPVNWFWGAIIVTELGLFISTGPTNAALANVTHPAIRATAFALNIFVIHLLGDAISPAMIGWITDQSHDMNAGFLAASVAMLVSGTFWLIAAKFLARDTELAPTRIPENGH